MKTSQLIAALVLFAALPLRADFNAVVRQVETRTGMKRVHIPFIGLARFCVWMVHPNGVHDFEVATFEGDSHDVDGRLLGEMLDRNVGAGFRQLVRVHSNRHGGEWTFIYARPVGDNFELMIATHDHQDTAVVRAVVDVERLQRTMNDGRHGHVMASLR